MIVKRINKAQHTNLQPLLWTFSLQDGALIYYCENQDTRGWLQINLNGVKIKEDFSLKVIDAKYLPSQWRCHSKPGTSKSYIPWSITMMELIFNTCGEFRWNLEGPVSQIQTSHLHIWAPGIFLDLLRYVQMLNRELSAKSKGKLPHLFVPSKTATLVP